MKSRSPSVKHCSWNCWNAWKWNWAVYTQFLRFRVFYCGTKPLIQLEHCQQPSIVSWLYVHSPPRKSAAVPMHIPFFFIKVPGEQIRQEIVDFCKSSFTSTYQVLDSMNIFTHPFSSWEVTVYARTYACTIHMPSSYWYMYIFWGMTFQKCHLCCLNLSYLRHEWNH